jgi:hypothetical protein
MDLSKLSDDDLKALADGNLSAMSTEGLELIAGSVQPQEQPSFLEKFVSAARPEPFAEGMAREMFESPALAVSQLATQMLGGSSNLEDYIRGREAEMQQLPLSGRVAGMIASPATALVASKVPQLMSALPVVGRSNLARSAATGATAAGITPVVGDDFAQEKATQAVTGAVLGPVLDIAAAPLARLGTPGGATPELQTLQRGGVDVSRLTPGQQLGGVTKRIEESLKSVPIAGEIVRQAETRGFQEFNKGVINSVLRQIDPKLQVPKAFDTRGAIDFTGKEISKAYKQALAPIKFPVDQQFRDDISSIAAKYAPSVSEENARLLDRLIKNNVLDLMPAGKVIPGGTLKRIDSDIGKLETNYLKSANAQDKIIGEALKEIKANIRFTIGQQDPTGKVNAANAAFADFLRVEAATASSRIPGGVFTPEQLMSATRSLDSSLRKGQFARGQARMQKTAEAGREVLGTRVPDSGTPERMGTLLGALGLGAAAGGGAAGLPLESLIIPGLLTGLYTRPGQAGLRSLSQLGPGLRSTLPVLAPQFTQE